jgi:hypothetical protein
MIGSSKQLGQLLYNVEQLSQLFMKLAAIPQAQVHNRGHFHPRDQEPKNALETLNSNC